MPQVDFPFPLHGKVDNWARFQQPPETTVDCLNVFPYDSAFRARGGRRPGLTVYSSFASAGNSNITGMFQADQNTLVYVSGGAGQINYKTSTGTEAAATGAAAAAGGTAKGVGGRGGAYFVQAAGITKLVLSTGIATALAASVGSIPTGCTVISVWRDRLVVAGPDQNWYMSRSGDYTDWDYAAQDVGGASAGNNTNSTIPGLIGDPLIALIALSDSVLIMAGYQRIWAMVGDPKDGGTIGLLSGGVGIMGPQAWAVDPEGNCWLACTGGLYKYSGGALEPVAVNNLVSFWRNLDRTANTVTLEWDRENHGCWIFVTPSTPGTATHLFYHEPTDSFWPQRYADAVGPVSVCNLDFGATRYMLLGGRDGTINQIAPTSNHDVLYVAGSTAISAYVWLGPVQPGGAQMDTMMTLWNFVLGEAISGGAIATSGSVRSANVTTVTTTTAHALLAGDTVIITGSVDTTFNGSFTVASTPTGTTFTVANPGTNGSTTGASVVSSALGTTYLIQTGRSAYEALANPVQSRTGALSGSAFIATIGARLTGNTFMVKLSSAADYFSFERLTAMATPGGRTRV